MPYDMILRLQKLIQWTKILKYSMFCHMQTLSQESTRKMQNGFIVIAPQYHIAQNRSKEFKSIMLRNVIYTCYTKLQVQYKSKQDKHICLQTSMLLKHPSLGMQFAGLSVGQILPPGTISKQSVSQFSAVFWQFMVVVLKLNFP